MKTLQIYEKKDLEKFEELVIYYLQSDDGFYRRQSCNVGSYNHGIDDNNTEALLRITEKIQKASDSELMELDMHLRKKVDESINLQVKAKNALDEAKENHHKFTQLCNMITHCVTFKEAFEKIIS